MPEYTEGICNDGAAILKDGEMITIDQVLKELNEVQKPEAVKSKSNDWLNANCCMTCKHWADEKEREKQVKEYKANPKCMDKKDGWPCAGDCNNTVAYGIELYIDGNATARLEYDANFGCNNWESHITLKLRRNEAN